eukprot:730756-Karenia_brevis.AAC.1
MAKSTPGAATKGEIEALDHAMKVGSRKGLKDFVTNTQFTYGVGRDLCTSQDWKQRNCLVLVSDQGPEMSAMAFYLSSRLRIMVLFDYLHRLWNNVKNALKHAGVWPIIGLLIQALNALRGLMGDLYTKQSSY